MNKLQTFWQMGGYGFYIWPAYVCVISILFYQWFISWRCWKKSKKS